MSEPSAEWADPDPDPRPDAAPATEAAHPEPRPEPEPERVPPDAPPEPTPLGLDPAVTGNAEVDAGLQRLADADELPTTGHVEVYEDVHRSLRDILTALDSRPGPGPGLGPGPGPGPRPAPPAPQPAPRPGWNRS